MNKLSDFIQPINESFIDFINQLPKTTLGKNMSVHFFNTNIELVPNSIALIGVPEDRTSINNQGCGENFNAIREKFYQLHLGNWKTPIYDLGDISKGNTFKDTEIAVQEVLLYLIKKKLIPIILGGSQALTYASYRTFDSLEQKVNLTVVDAKFDLGTIESRIDSQSYLTKIVMDQPNNLFNFTNIGYQTFLNSPEEIGLLNTLLFDTYRLGDVKNDLELVEPTLRDTDVLSIDLGSIRKTDAPANNNGQISGFIADDICKITRYAGLSDKLKVLGVYEYNPHKDREDITAELVAQMIWYFIEGVNLRSYEFPSNNLKGFKKYMVMIADDTLQFYKSDKSGRWWMEISLKENNKTKRQTLIPCTYADYLTANKQEIPERWYVNRKKID